YFAAGDAAVADDIDLEVRLRQQAEQEGACHHGEDGAVDQHARPRHMAQDFLPAPALREGVLGGVANHAAWVTHLPHDLIVGVDTGGATDTFILQAVANIDAGRAHLHADMAIDTIALAYALGIDALLARAARFATRLVIGDGERIRVEHLALEARIRAHVLAH